MKVRRSIRVNTSLCGSSNRKLRLLANSCNKPRATMAQLLLDHCLNDPLLVQAMQDLYNTVQDYRVFAIPKDGKCVYMLKNEKVDQSEKAIFEEYQTLKSLGVLV